MISVHYKLSSLSISNHNNLHYNFCIHLRIELIYTIQHTAFTSRKSVITIISVCCCGFLYCLYYTTDHCVKIRPLASDAIKKPSETFLTVSEGRIVLVLSHDYFKLSLTSIRANPSKFCPFHFAGSVTPSSSLLIPMPHILSYGLASTKILFPVLIRYSLSSEF